MKNCKFLIIALLLSILTLPSSGQSRRYDDYGRSSRSGSAIKGVEWGVLAGLNFPHFSTSGPDFGIDNRLGWQAGLQIGLKFRYFTIGPEVLYVRQSIKLSHADYGKPIRSIFPSSSRFGRFRCCGSTSVPSLR